MKRKTKWIVAGCAAGVLIAVLAFWFWPRTFPIPNKPIAAVTVTDMYPDIAEEPNVEVSTRVLSAEEYKPLLQKIDKTPYKLRLLQLRCLPRYRLLVTFTDGKQIEYTGHSIKRGKIKTRIWSPALEEILAAYFDGQSGGCQHGRSYEA